MGILDKVYDETYGHSSDKLDRWLECVKPHVIATEENAGILERYQRVLAHVASGQSGYQPMAVSDWAPRHIADPWLISAAGESETAIVTFEQGQHDNDRPWKHPKIPTVANTMGVECMDLFEFMRRTNAF